MGSVHTVAYPERLGDHNTSLCAETMMANFSFFSCISVKICWTTINDFTIHLIISKSLSRQKWRQKKKTMWQKDVKAKKKIGYKSVFIHLNMQ